jgi:hypothetical protein
MVLSGASLRLQDLLLFVEMLWARCYPGRRVFTPRRSEADAKGVDAWLTEDQTHVVKIASHRAPDK